MDRSYRLRDGSVVQARTAAEAREALTLATLCKDTGTEADDPGFRAFAASRARELGTGDEGDLTELLGFEPERVDGVVEAATGAGFLMMKGIPRTAGAGGAPLAPLAPAAIHGTVIKADGEQRFTLCLAYPALRPDVNKATDGHRDFAGPQALEDAAWHYLTKSPAIGLWHQEGTEGAGQVVESYIYRGPDWTITAGDETQVIKAGDWLLGVQWSPDTWHLVKQGLIGGVSMQGRARRGTPSAESLAGLRKSAAAAVRRTSLLAKAADYARKARVVSDPQMARDYRELARQARQEAGVR